MRKSRSERERATSAHDKKLVVSADIPELDKPKSMNNLENNLSALLTLPGLNHNCSVLMQSSQPGSREETELHHLGQSSGVSSPVQMVLQPTVPAPVFTYTLG